MTEGKEKFEKDLYSYEPGTIEHQMQPEGGRDLSSYEQHLLFNRAELKDKVVVDLGSGPEAKFAKQLKESGIEADVISVSPDFSQEKHLEKVKKSFPEGKFIAATAQALSLKDESCDRIFAFHLIEHLSMERFLRCISEMARALKDGGKAIMGPNPDVYDPYWANLMENKELLEKLKKEGIEVALENIPKENLLIESLKVYYGYGAASKRFYNVTCHNIVLVKSGNNG